MKSLTSVREKKEKEDFMGGGGSHPHLLFIEKDRELGRIEFKDALR